MTLGEVCEVCSSRSWRLCYEGLSDRLHDTPGTFSIYQCADCGVLRLLPVPHDLAACYPIDYYSYTAGPGRLSPAKDRVLRWLLRRALAGSWTARRVVSGRSVGGELLRYIRGQYARLLDVGCGAGDFLVEAKRFGLEATGLDTNAAAVEAARLRGFECFAGTLEESPVEEQYDVIRLSHVLEHVPSPLGMLQAARLRLRPGGRVAIITPDADSYLARAFGARWFQLDPPRHLWAFSAPHLAVLTGRADLRVVSISHHSLGNSVERSFRYLINDDKPGAAAPAGGAAHWQAIADQLDLLGLGDTMLCVAQVAIPHYR